MRDAAASPFKNPRLLLAVVFLCLWGFLIAGCTDLPRSTNGTDASMTLPITDTAAIYRVHGIRFVIPTELVPATNEYVFSDLEPGKIAEFHNHSLIKVSYWNGRSPDSILSEVLDRVEDPRVFNQARTRINGRMVTQTSITYTERDAQPSSRSADTIRVDYAFIVDATKGETWGIRRIPSSVNMTSEEIQEWSDMIESVSPTRSSDPTFIGSREQDGTRFFHTKEFRVRMPPRWRLINTLTFVPGEVYREQRLGPMHELTRAYLSVSSTMLPKDSDERDVQNLEGSLKQFGLSGVVEEKRLFDRPVEWIELEPREEGRVRTAGQRAAISLLETADYDHIVSLDMEVGYTVSGPSDEPPPLVQDMREIHQKVYSSIEL